jgi:hypothetical protein
MKRLTCLLLLVGLLSLVSGCSGGGGPKGPPVAKVSGTVKLDGKPMQGGEIRFYAEGQPAKTMEIKDGAFSGEAHTGKNRVDVLWEKDGPPHPMDPSQKLKVNTVSAQFSGASSILNAEVGEGGKSDLTFEVTSARR